MKNLKKLNLFGLALVMSLFTLQLSAQGGQGGQRQGGQGQGGGPGRGFQMTEEDIKERVDNLGETLEFSKDQHKKILTYEMEFNNKMQIQRQQMRNSGGDVDREAMRETMRKAREERDQKYEEVLTKDQMVKYKEIQEQRRTEMRQQNQQRESGGQQGDRPERGRGRN